MTMNRIHPLRIAALLLALLLAVLPLAACKREQEDGVDYTAAENWAYFGVGEGKEAASF